MTALRFQTGEQHQTSPASLQNRRRKNKKQKRKEEKKSRYGQMKLDLRMNTSSKTKVTYILKMTQRRMCNKTHRFIAISNENRDTNYKARSK